MARSPSVLTAKPVLKEVKIRLSATLLERLESLDQQIEATAPSHIFDRSAICEAALSEAHAVAQRELEQISASGAGSKA